MSATLKRSRRCCEIDDIVDKTANYSYMTQPWLVTISSAQTSVCNQATLQAGSPLASSCLPPTKPPPSAPSDSRSLLSLPPCSEWKGIHSAMNVNQSEDESGPNAALLLWSTQAGQHLTENFLIAPLELLHKWLGSGHYLSLFPFFWEGDYCAPHQQAKAIISTALGNLVAMNALDLSSSLY